MYLICRYKDMLHGRFRKKDGKVLKFYFQKTDNKIKEEYPCLNIPYDQDEVGNDDNLLSD